MSRSAAVALDPPRWTPEALRAAIFVGVVGLLVTGALVGTGFSPTQLQEGLPRMARLIGEMLPPDFSRISAILSALGTTALIAVAGTGVGLMLSLPFGVLASRKHSPLGTVHWLFQAFLAFVRTIPELVWAILFVSCLGPGAFAGVMAICVDTLGFAGRFFAGAIDDSYPEPQEALTSLGASPILVLLGATLPAALAPMIHTSLYALERAIRASLVLGIVGAGGIGIELKVAMDLFEHRKASAIILSILAVVLIVEFVGSTIRRQLKASNSADR